LAGVVVLVVLVLAAALAAHKLLERQPASLRSQGRAAKHTAPAAPPQRPPATLPNPAAPKKPAGQPRANLPLAAVIIDDVGYDHRIAEGFLDLNAPLTFAILPHSPFQKRIARTVYAQGREIMLHLPMEPEGYPQVNPGPGTLLTTMTPAEFTRQLQRDLDAVAHIRGVNNHMGSKMSADAACMNRIFDALAAKELYFIDSRSTASTVCRQVACRRRLPFAERDIFLDHDTDVAFMAEQLRRLVEVARRQGAAVAIAHPHQETLLFMRQHLPQLRQKVQLVSASAVVRPGGARPNREPARRQTDIRTPR
jgi:polysaccharide deacetylase 2 family uncharacterized protein YibQ